MNLKQRVVLVLYCAAITYCCVWIPWRFTYGHDLTKTTFGVYSFVWLYPDEGFRRGYSATPDMHLIFLRIVTTSAIGAALFAIISPREN